MRSSNRPHPLFATVAALFRRRARAARIVVMRATQAPHESTLNTRARCAKQAGWFESLSIWRMQPTTLWSGPKGTSVE